MIDGHKRRALYGVMLSVFLAAMESTVVATAMPTVVASLGGLQIYSWVFSGFLLTPRSRSGVGPALHQSAGAPIPPGHDLSRPVGALRRGAEHGAAARVPGVRAGAGRC